MFRVPSFRRGRHRSLPRLSSTPAGVIAGQFLFSGVASGTVPNGGRLISDPLAINIPKGAKYYIRRYVTNTAGIFIQAGVQDNANGDKCNFGASGIPDQTMTTAFTEAGGAFLHFPVAVLGMTKLATVYGNGDSRFFGTGDTYSGTAGYLGAFSRSIAPVFGCINGVSAANRLKNWTSGQANQRALADYCSHMVLELGVNDLSGGRTSAQVLADRATIRALFPTKIIFDTTIEPLVPPANTTDGWTTAGGQTPAIWNAQRVAVNTAVRAMTNNFDISSAVENSINDGKWKSTGGLSRTGDGTHENTLGYSDIFTSGVVDTSKIVYA